MTVVRLFKWSLPAFAALALLSGGTLWLALRGSLPQYDGTVLADGLAAPVIVERDALGTATLRAEDRADLVWTLGYVHAQERFFEMDLMRRRAAGELAELFGPAALPADREARRHRMRARASSQLESLPPDERKLLDTYRDGINSGLTALDLSPFPYLLTRTRPVRWCTEDSLLVVKAMYFTLNDADNQHELGLSTLRAALPESAYRFLAASGGEWDAPLIGPALRWPDPPSPDELDLRNIDPTLMRDREKHKEELPGSNNFAVAGELAGTTGAALIANDIHLALRVPNIWFRTRLIYPSTRHPGKTNDIIGVSLPGTPAIAVGSNRRIAWSFTNSYADLMDWVRVTRHPDDASRYRSTSGWKPFAVHREILHARDAPDEILDVYETEWGPLLAFDHDGTPLALAWVAHEPGSVNMELSGLEQTDTVEEAITIAQKASIPPQNFIVGDRSGKIGWTIVGRIPTRSGNYDPRLPADWSRPDTGWQGWLKPEQYPLILDRQRLWTANARTVDGAYLDLLGDGDYDLGARARQIRDSLNEHDHFEPITMLAIQLDDRALLLDRWHRLLEQTLADHDRTEWRTAMQQALRDWNGHAATQSAGYLLVRSFRKEVLHSALDGFSAAVRRSHPAFSLPDLNRAENAVWTLIEQRPAHLLPPLYSTWDDLLDKCARRVAERMQSQPGGIAARNWGEHNTARIRHPFSRALPGFIGSWLDMPQDPLPGDNHIPRVQGPSFGASTRFAVSPGDEEHGYFEMPGGQSGHPLSPYYGSGHADWVKGIPTPFLPGPTERTLRLHPPG